MEVRAASLLRRGILPADEEAFPRAAGAAVFARRDRDTREPVPRSDARVFRRRRMEMDARTNGIGAGGRLEAEEACAERPMYTSYPGFGGQPPLAGPEFAPGLPHQSGIRAGLQTHATEAPSTHTHIAREVRL